jgi:hypothetical protein
MHAKSIRTCAYCGTDFPPQTKKQRFCSISCGLRTRSVPFWDRVRKSAGCWEWTGTQHGAGYGYCYSKGRLHLTHRMAWELTYGPIPDGQCVLHKCDNRSCVRPDHLFLGTRGDNIKDAVSKGRQCRGEGKSMAKLTDDSVRAFRARYAAGGVTIGELADEAGIHLQTMYLALKRRTWKHVTD